MRILVVSSNERKLEELTKLLGNDFETETLQMEYPEIQHESSCEVTKAAAKALAEKLNKTVLVEDSGMFVDALKGFPGPWTKYSHNTIGNEGILKLMKGVKRRKAYYKSAVGVCSPGKKPLCFLGEEDGTIAMKIRGSKGWGQDPIFIPRGSKKTYGELGYPDGYHPFRANAIKKMKEFFAGK